MNRILQSKCLALSASLGAVALVAYLIVPQRKEAPAIEPAQPALEGPGHVKAPELLRSALARLHGEAVQRFINRPGKGISRFIITPTKVEKPWNDPFMSPGELDRETPVTARNDLTKIHQESLSDFQSLTANSPPPPENVVLVDAIKQMKEKDWDIKSLDLVGLAKHADAVVYVSEKLPEMKDLANVPKRSPDFFEQAGLDHLQKGNDLFIREREGTIRMLGAVRVSEACVRCHRSAEGTLLGAFSYTLRPAQYVDTRGDGQQAINS